MATDQLSIFDLTGKTAIVTGAANGIGESSATAMAGAGATVVCADINVDRLAQAVDKIVASGLKAVAIRCDVTDEDSVAELIERCERDVGPLDIMMNNAGTLDATPSLVHEADSADWQRVLGLNLTAVFFGCRAALKVMYERKSGRIINTASTFGLLGPSQLAPLSGYAASKGGVVNLTRELALQYAPHGININAIAPGPFHTGLAGIYEIPDIYNRFVALTPMGRVAQVEEIRGTVLYLASQASSFVTGSILTVDGGWTAQ